MSRLGRGVWPHALHCHTEDRKYWNAPGSPQHTLVPQKKLTDTYKSRIGTQICRNTNLLSFPTSFGIMSWFWAIRSLTLWQSANRSYIHICFGHSLGIGTCGRRRAWFVCYRPWGIANCCIPCRSGVKPTERRILVVPGVLVNLPWSNRIFTWKDKKKVIWTPTFLCTCKLTVLDDF